MANSQTAFRFLAIYDDIKAINQLRQFNFQVTACSGIEVARKLLRENVFRFDGIVIDIHLVEQNEYEFIQFLKNELNYLPLYVTYDGDYDEALRKSLENAEKYMQGVNYRFRALTTPPTDFLDDAVILQSDIRAPQTHPNETSFRVPTCPPFHVLNDLMQRHIRAPQTHFPIPPETSSRFPSFPPFNVLTDLQGYAPQTKVHVPLNTHVYVMNSTPLNANTNFQDYTPETNVRDTHVNIPDFTSLNVYTNLQTKVHAPQTHVLYPSWKLENAFEYLQRERPDRQTQFHVPSEIIVPVPSLTLASLPNPKYDDADVSTELKL